MPDTTITEGGAGRAGRHVAPDESASRSPRAPAKPAAAARGTGDRLLWIVAGAFALLLNAWSVFIVIACSHPVVPVPTAASR